MTPLRRRHPRPDRGLHRPDPGLAIGFAIGLVAALIFT